MASSTVLRASEGRSMPWKNGGGTTLEIAVHPPAATLDDVDWRVSLASITAGGPFSLFPGLDRTLVVIAGDGLVLAVDGQEPVRLEAASDPFGFAADVPCTAQLLSGPVTDLNVMTRRSRFRHVVERIHLNERAEMDVQATTLVVCCAGTVMTADQLLAPHDCLLANGPQAVSLVPRGDAVCVVITIRPA